MSDSERHAERRQELSRRILENIESRSEQEPKKDWTIFYNEQHLKLRWDVFGLDRHEMEALCRRLYEAFGKRPKVRLM